jgi:chromosome segregation ATPase
MQPARRTTGRESIEQEELKRAEMQVQAAAKLAEVESAHAEQVELYKAKEQEYHSALTQLQHAMQAAQVELAERKAQVSQLRAHDDQSLVDNAQLRSNVTALQSKLDKLSASYVASQHEQSQQHTAELHRAHEGARRQLAQGRGLASEREGTSATDQFLGTRAGRFLGQRRST